MVNVLQRYKNQPKVPKLSADSSLFTLHRRQPILHSSLSEGPVAHTTGRCNRRDERRFSHWDRYLGMMTAMTQVPVPRL